MTYRKRSIQSLPFYGECLFCVTIARIIVSVEKNVSQHMFLKGRLYNLTLPILSLQGATTLFSVWKLALTGQRTHHRQGKRHKFGVSGEQYGL